MLNLNRLLIVIFATTLSACGGGSSNDDDDDAIVLPSNMVAQGVINPSESLTNTELPAIPALIYADSRISFMYPASWSIEVEEDGTGMDIDLDAPAVPGEDLISCGVSYSFSPGESLIEGVDVVLQLLDDVPEPEVAFLEVNGTEASRVRGNVTLFGVTIPSNFQLMVDDEYAYATFCLGTESDESFDLIMNSFVLN